ncbi:four helix bundle protein [Parapedobacter sp. SGR-10]|uniref:four helix bundle protein n=1 Tax=Parapedobacter sp. SGR-10 TaxID=2710879 RepID=UPI0013D0DD4F|nr:four helix bundle protein [Parapedobacter sp. SGR-10]NGF55924.1 four helix bundle protein [Parapedobacter sp. SGR-10]
MRDFKRYEVWEKSHRLTLHIFEVTKSFPSDEKFRIISQMQRAAYSIPSNFAEGCGRRSDKDFDRFIQISLGSAHELEYFVILSKDLNFIDITVSSTLIEEINMVKKQLFSLSQKLKQL